jgi:hypothetical protein
MPKKKEPKYRIMLYDPKKAEVLQIALADGDKKHILVTKKEMQFIIGIYEQLKGITGRDE